MNNIDKYGRVFMGLKYLVLWNCQSCLVDLQIQLNPNLNDCGYPVCVCVCVCVCVPVYTYVCVEVDVHENFNDQK